MKDSVKCKKEYIGLFVGIFIIAISTFWFVMEINEWLTYTHANGIAISAIDEKNNVHVQYEYGFNTYEGVVIVPTYVAASQSKNIDVMFDKNNYLDVVYGKDTRIYAAIASLFGILIFLYHVFKIQSEKISI